MSRPIVCFSCKTPLGEIRKGSKLLKGVEHSCSACAKEAKQLITMKIAKAFGDIKSPFDNVAPFDAFKDIFGKGK